MSDKLFVRIYDGQEKGTKPALQYYYDYLPKSPCPDRKVILTSKLVCPKHNKIVIMFSYAESMLCNRLLIMPFINDRHIMLNEKHRQACWLG